MDAKLYYTAPTDEQFEELKAAAIMIWSKLGAEPTYAHEKISRIKDLPNVKDNFMYMVAMFDMYNQLWLAVSLSKGTRAAVRARLIDGGMPEEYIQF